mmetsp:Transcript_20024/g.51996  ORF Transcript_20024/g.51996 Transcript_20024/m.51996 type:complete len:161 (-) Transcript_20024:1502-1984(-)
MDKVEKALESVEDMLKTHEDNPAVTQITNLAQQAGVPRSKFTGGVAGALVLITLFLCGLELIAILVGIIYPSQASINVIKSGDIDAARVWLTYWLIFGSMMLLSQFSDTITFWIPIFTQLQILFLAYCQAPIENNGAAVIYNKVFKKMVTANVGEEVKED